jgi:hypothetical protein
MRVDAAIESMFEDSDMKHSVGAWYSRFTSAVSLLWNVASRGLLAACLVAEIALLHSRI